MNYQPYWAIAALEHVAYCNDFAEAQGWGANNLSLPMSATGLEPATHMGGHLGLLLDVPRPNSTEASALGLNTVLAGKAEVFPATDEPYAALEAKGLKIIEPSSELLTAPSEV
jgi:hypothetical protein